MGEIDDPKNYRSIKYLSTTYKLITSVLTNYTYSSLNENNFLPLEQIGCQRGSYSFEDQVLIKKMILKVARKEVEISEKHG